MSTRGAWGDVQQLGCRRGIEIEKHSERKHLPLTLWESMNRRKQIAIDKGRIRLWRSSYVTRELHPRKLSSLPTPRRDVGV
jgi:hypothetical protein